MASENLGLYFAGVGDLVREFSAKIRILENEIVYLKERNRILQKQIDTMVDEEQERAHFGDD